MEKENQIMMIIANAGDAKSKAFEAIGEAKSGNTDQMEKLFHEGDTALKLAHELHTDLLQSSLDDPNAAVTMLMVHAQDHLMNTFTMLDMAREICGLYGLIFERTPRGRDQE